MTLPSILFHIDFETRSELDIKIVGSRVYAEHPSTEIMMISFSIDEVEIFNWNPFFPNKRTYKRLMVFISMVLNKKSKTHITAFNSEFEYWIWNLVAIRQFNWPEIPIEYFYDIMCVSCINGFPAALANAAIALGIDEQKDKGGMALINFFSKPSRKQDEKFKDPHDYPEKFGEFVLYCDQDVRTQIAINNACWPMTPRQHRVFILTEKMNVRGLPIDKSMAEGALKLVAQYKNIANKQIQKITKGKIESATQNIKLVEWLNDNGCDIPNMQAPVVEKYIQDKRTSKLAKKVLRIRSNVSKSSTAKYTKALDQLTIHNTVHGFIKAFIAITGRWGGRGLQIQNFSKPHKDFPYWADYNVIAQGISDVDLWFLELLYDDIMEVLKAATRAMIHAPKEFKFISADYSQIEARIVMWIANDPVGLADFAGEGKIYENMASDIFSIKASKITKPSFERDVGKEVVLGCGFGMGEDKFVNRCVNDRNLPVTKLMGGIAVKGYRKRYKEVPKAWKDCEKAAVKAIESPGIVFEACNGKYKYRMSDKHLQVKLPSGRKLTYPFVKVSYEYNDWGYEQLVIYYKHWVDNAKVGEKWQYTKIWGGTLFQHGVQATAMDIMAHGMLTAEKRGYPALFTVHDESLAMVSIDFGSVTEYEEILCELEPWAEGLPIIAEGWEGKRYKK